MRKITISIVAVIALSGCTHNEVPINPSPSISPPSSSPSPSPSPSLPKPSPTFSPIDPGGDLIKPSKEEEEVISEYYASCADARDAGAAPLHRGDPGYRAKLDRDGDGVACEN